MPVQLTQYLHTTNQPGFSRYTGSNVINGLGQVMSDCSVWGRGGGCRGVIIRLLHDATLGRSPAAFDDAPTRLGVGGLVRGWRGDLLLRLGGTWDVGA